MQTLTKEENQIKINKKINFCIDQKWFDPNFWYLQGNLYEKLYTGTKIYEIQLENTSWILKHYCRKKNNIINKILDDKYIYIHKEYTKSFYEFSVLNLLEQQKIPAPKAVAAQFHKKGLLYTADILIEKIPQCKKLIYWLQKSYLPIKIWQEIGLKIALLHRAGVDHQQLNLSSIIWDGKEIYFINFEKSIQRIYKGSWRDKDLMRLKAAIIRAKTTYNIKFQKLEWNALVASYKKNIF